MADLTAEITTVAKKKYSISNAGCYSEANITVGGVSVWVKESQVDLAYTIAKAHGTTLQKRPTYISDSAQSLGSGLVLY